MSDLLDQFPEVVEWRARVERAEQALHSVVQQEAEVSARWEVARNEHKAQVREAAATGAPVPEEPPQPPQAYVEAVQAARQNHMAVRGELDDVLAGIAGKVEAAATERIAKTTAKAAKPVDVLSQCAAEITADLHLLARVRRAQQKASGRVTRPSPADLTRTSVTPAQLVDAVRAGTDLAAPVPHLGMVSRIQRFDGTEPSPDGGYERRALARLRGVDWPRVDRSRGRLP